MEYKIISFYKYIKIENPGEFKNWIRTVCLELGILGRILISNEGINAAICGRIEDIERFKELIKTNVLFNDLTFREQLYKENTYHKLVTRVRNEIVYFGKNVDLSKKGNYLTPKELKELLDKNEDIILIDARNNYEYKIGRFKNSIDLGIETFREFPEKLEELKKFKDKKIVLFCTGGIRCEKASAYLNENNFKYVNHIQGGIINYVNQYPNTHFEGSCFVFDDRAVSKVSNNIVSNCELCGKSSDDYINCHNMDCDKLFISCNECQEKMNKSCSLECKNALRRRKEKKEIKIIGIVEKYFKKNKVAQIRLKDNVNVGDNLTFVGNTTNFNQEVKEVRFHDQDLVTIPVKDRVRENDKLILECS